MSSTIVYSVTPQMQYPVNITVTTPLTPAINGVVTFRFICVLAAIPVDDTLAIVRFTKVLTAGYDNVRAPSIKAVCPAERENTADVLATRPELCVTKTR